MQHLLVANSIDIADDLRYDFSKVSGNILLDNFTDHFQIVNRPTHLSGSIRSCLYQENLNGRIFY